MPQCVNLTPDQLQAYLAAGWTLVSGPYSTSDQCGASCGSSSLSQSAQSIRPSSVLSSLAPSSVLSSQALSSTVPSSVAPSSIIGSSQSAASGSCCLGPCPHLLFTKISGPGPASFVVCLFKSGNVYQGIHGTSSLTLTGDCGDPRAFRLAITGGGGITIIYNARGSATCATICFDNVEEGGIYTACVVDDRTCCSSVSASSVSGITVACCVLPMPLVLYATFTQQTPGCECLDGLVVPITWNGTDWEADFTACGGSPGSSTLKLVCDLGGAFTLFLLGFCSPGGSGEISLASQRCPPAPVFVSVGTTVGCCTGTVTITITA